VVISATTELTTVILARQLIYYTKERKQGRRIAIAPRAQTETWCRSKNQPIIHPKGRKRQPNSFIPSLANLKILYTSEANGQSVFVESLNHD